MPGIDGLCFQALITSGAIAVVSGRSAASASSARNASPAASVVRPDRSGRRPRPGLRPGVVGVLGRRGAGRGRRAAGAGHQHLRRLVLERPRQQNCRARGARQRPATAPGNLPARHRPSLDRCDLPGLDLLKHSAFPALRPGSLDPKLE